MDIQGNDRISVLGTNDALRRLSICDVWLRDDFMMQKSAGVRIYKRKKYRDLNTKLSNIVYT